MVFLQTLIYADSWERAGLFSFGRDVFWGTHCVHVSSQRGIQRKGHVFQQSTMTHLMKSKGTLSRPYFSSWGSWDALPTHNREKSRFISSGLVVSLQTCLFFCTMWVSCWLWWSHQRYFALVAISIQGERKRQDKATFCHAIVKATLVKNRGYSKA